MPLNLDLLNTDEQRVYSALKTVIDPEVGENIIDLGLVYGIEVQNGIARITFTMTSYACPMSEMVIEEIDEKVSKAIEPNIALDLNLVWEPAWDPAMICESTKQKLGWDK